MGSRLKVLFTAFAVGLLAMPAWAQDSAPTTLQDAINGYESSTSNGYQGLPTDWSHHHVIFSRPAPGSSSYEQVTHDPRYWQQQIRRSLPESEASVAAEVRAQIESKKSKSKKKKGTLNGDWGVSLGTGATVGPSGLPAKFSFSSSATPSCANDYVAFNTGLAGSGAIASIIAYDELYAGTTGGGCGTVGAGVPTINWQYNTDTGTIRRSVALSGDGKQVAFVQSGIGGQTGFAALVLLKWANNASLVQLTSSRAQPISFNNGSTTITATSGSFQAGDVGAIIIGSTSGIPVGSFIVSQAGTTATISQTTTNTRTNTGTIFNFNGTTVVNPAGYRACTAPCMTYIVLNQSGGIVDDPSSSPFYSFGADALYVGDSAGRLHKFSGVFSGTPAEVTSSWPITVSAGHALTDPIFDAGSGNIFVEDITNGFLFYVREVGSSGTPAIGGACGAGSPPCLGTPSVDLEAGGGRTVSDSPIVDTQSHEVFGFVPCSLTGDAGGQCGDDQMGGNSMAEVVQTTTALGGVVRAAIGFSSASDNVFDGDFDNNYYSGTYSSGHLYACGSPATNISRVLYSLSFNASGVLSTTVVTGPTLTSAAASNCSPITEFDNGTTDLIFLGVTANGNITPTGNACGAGSCIYDFNVTSPPITAATKPVNGFAVTGGPSGIVIDNAGVTSGASQVYFSTLANGTCATSGTGGCAVQASQSGLR